VAGDFSWLVVMPAPGNILRSDRKITSREHQSYGKAAYRSLDGQNLTIPMCPARFDGRSNQRLQVSSTIQAKQLGGISLQETSEISL